MIKVFTASNEGIGQAMGLVEDYLNKKGIPRRESILFMLSAEDTMGSLVSRGVNTVRMSVQCTKHPPILWTLGALCAALLLGVLLSLAGMPSFARVLDSALLTPAKTMYINALKMIVAPVVFFSVASCISQFGDIRDLGCISSKILFLYLSKTLAAAAVGIGVFYLFRPGDASLTAGVESGTAVASQPLNISVTDTIVGIVLDHQHRRGFNRVLVDPPANSFIRFTTASFAASSSEKALALPAQTPQRKACS